MKKQLNNFYIVQKHDNIETIAQKYNLNPVAILIKNNLTPSMIKEGVILIL